MNFANQSICFRIRKKKEKKKGATEIFARNKNLGKKNVS